MLLRAQGPLQAPKNHQNHRISSNLKVLLNGKKVPTKCQHSVWFFNMFCKSIGDTVQKKAGIACCILNVIGETSRGIAPKKCEHSVLFVKRVWRQKWRHNNYLHFSIKYRNFYTQKVFSWWTSNFFVARIGHYDLIDRNNTISFHFYIDRNTLKAASLDNRAAFSS